MPTPKDRPGLMDLQEQHQGGVSMGAASAGREHLIRRTAAMKVRDLVSCLNSADGGGDCAFTSYKKE